LNANGSAVSRFDRVAAFVLVRLQQMFLSSQITSFMSPHNDVSIALGKLISSSPERQRKRFLDYAPPH